MTTRYLLLAAAVLFTAGATPFRDCDDCPLMMPLDDGTAIAVHMVTRDEFAVFAAEEGVPADGGCVLRTRTDWQNTAGKGWGDPGFAQGGDHPVVCVSWLEATAFADWMSLRTGQSYRLPTWEESAAAAIAGATTRFWWGDDFAEVCARANAADAAYRVVFPEDPRNILSCDDGFAHTSPVTAFAPNPLGLHDAVGNAWEWTNSCLRGDCSNALFRGGAWTVPNPNHFASDGQWADRIVLRNSAIGLRLLRDAP